MDYKNPNTMMMIVSTISIKSNPEIYLFLFYPGTSSMTENINNAGRSTVLHIPFVAVRTPSDDSNRSSSFTSSVSRQTPTPTPCSSVRKTVKNFFRPSRTIDNMSSVLNNGNQSSKTDSNFLKLKSSSHLSHSQPIVYENFHYDSPFINHTEQTPLIDRRMESKNIKLTTQLNRQELHLPLDIDCLPRSRSCTDGVITQPNHQETDSINPMVSTLHPNSSDTGSLRSADSTGSSLSAYLSAQQQLTTQQTNENPKNEINKSQESIFSLSSPVKKQRSIKSLIMAAATKAKATKQDNDVLVLIASWVLRSPEDFQGIKTNEIDFYFSILIFFLLDHLVQKELRSFFTLLESLRSSFRTWTSQIKEILALQVNDQNIFYYILLLLSI
jgi:hypothetical protein